MVRSLLLKLLFFCCKLGCVLRYRMTVTGLDVFANIDKSKGIVVMPSHPSQLDPVLVSVIAFPFAKLRPLVIEYVFYMPGMRSLMEIIGALPIPGFEGKGNSVKKNRVEKTFAGIFQALRKGEALLFYPAGRLRRSSAELLGGASGCQRILTEVPEVNVILVRITGLWGSQFSRALTGKVPPLGTGLVKACIQVVKNLFFFTPRRNVLLEFELLPKDFPRTGTRRECNAFLERWYNAPYSQDPQKLKGEPLSLVPSTFFSKELPSVLGIELKDNEQFDLSALPSGVQGTVKAFLASLCSTPQEKMTLETDLARDLGLDSLNAAEILVFLEEKFGQTDVPIEALGTIGSVCALACGQRLSSSQEQKTQHDGILHEWNRHKERLPLFLTEGDTLGEVFLKTCEERKASIAAVDEMLGIFSYGKLRSRVITLALALRKMPGETIGILLPASMGAQILVFAAILAKKVPVMINWTVGSAHIAAVSEIAKVGTILSSWRFIDKLENVDFAGVEEKVLLLEDLRANFSLQDIVLAQFLSLRSPAALASHFELKSVKADDPAVFLFTSGTESLPKGVPLSHRNILSNISAALRCIDLRQDDIIACILPPFHSFGFTVTGLFPLLVGMRVAYFPDPTNGFGVAEMLLRWKVTILPAPPTFLRGILNNAKNLSSLRIVLSGAEAMPPDLFAMLEKSHIRLLEGYGITECAPMLCVTRDLSGKAGVGKPLDNVELCIIDAETLTPKALPSGQTGMILASGPNIFSGYLGQNTANPFLDLDGKRWYKTGDLGYFDLDGNLHISGRLKRFVKIGGEMVSLASLEEALMRQGLLLGWPLSPETPSFAVVATEEKGERPKLFLVTTLSITLDTANSALRQAGLSNLARLTALHTVSSIPLTGTGKIDFRTLQKEIQGLCC